MSPDPTPDLGVPVKTDPAELLLDLLTSPDDSDADVEADLRAMGVDVEASRAKFRAFLGALEARAVAKVADVLPPAPQNCWTCRHARNDMTECADDSVGLDPDQLDSASIVWLRAARAGAARCPRQVGGCPGWQPTDPPPSAEVPRG